jgi:hypothetical protein
MIRKLRPLILALSIIGVLFLSSGCNFTKPAGALRVTTATVFSEGGAPTLIAEVPVNGQFLSGTVGMAQQIAFDNFTNAFGIYDVLNPARPANWIVNAALNARIFGCPPLTRTGTIGTDGGQFNFACVIF